MLVDPNAEIMSHTIQLAIAPVFLLTAIGGLLGVMATRLARIVDRARSFEDRWSAMDAKARTAARVEIIAIDRRRRVCNWSINLCTAAALFVCLVIITLFADAFAAINLKWLAGSLFVVAVLGVIGGLTCFLREVALATQAAMVIDTTMLDWFSTESSQ